MLELDGVWFKHLFGVSIAHSINFQHHCSVFKAKFMAKCDELMDVRADEQTFLKHITIISDSQAAVKALGVNTTNFGIIYTNNKAFNGMTECNNLHIMNGSFSSKISKERPLQSMAIVIGPC